MAGVLSRRIGTTYPPRCTAGRLGVARGQVLPVGAKILGSKHGVVPALGGTLELEKEFVGP